MRQRLFSRFGFDGVLLLCRSHLHPWARQPDHTDRTHGSAEPGRLIHLSSCRRRRGATVIEQQQQTLPDQSERVPHITTTIKKPTSSGAPLKSAINRAQTQSENCYNVSHIWMTARYACGIRIGKLRRLTNALMGMCGVIVCATAPCPHPPFSCAVMKRTPRTAAGLRSAGYRGNWAAPSTGHCTPHSPSTHFSGGPKLSRDLHALIWSRAATRRSVRVEKKAQLHTYTSFKIRFLLGRIQCCIRMLQNTFSLQHF